MHHNANMEQQIFIKVSEAIAAHNRNRAKKKMTLNSLGSVVFAGEKLKNENTMGQYLSRWQHGELLHKCKIGHIVRMSQATGVPISELVLVVTKENSF